MMCARCHRILLRPPVMRGGMGFGPRCAALMAGPQPRPARVMSVRRVRVDAQQQELFAEARP